MNIFLTGAGGYIGGTIAAHLIRSGHQVRGLVRSCDKAAQLEQAGVIPVIGSLEDASVLSAEARVADAVINTADADHLSSVRVFLDALAGSQKPFIHTSGSSVVGDDARGASVSESIFDEDTPFVVAPLKAERHALNSLVLAASASGVRSMVICPTLIYGTGEGLNPHSIQIPFLFERAKESGVARVVGKGLNRWSTVHIQDLADLYLLALEGAPAGAFYFAENGESSFAEIGEAIAARLGLGPVQSWPAEAAAAEWGPARAFFTFGSNSRVRAKRSRRELGWQPRHPSATDWIRDEMSTSAQAQNDS